MPPHRPDVPAAFARDIVQFKNHLKIITWLLPHVLDANMRFCGQSWDCCGKCKQHLHFSPPVDGLWMGGSLWKLWGPIGRRPHVLAMLLAYWPFSVWRKETCLLPPVPLPLSLTHLGARWVQILRGGTGCQTVYSYRDKSSLEFLLAYLASLLLSLTWSILFLNSTLVLRCICRWSSNYKPYQSNI